MQIYIHRNNQQLGPFAEDEIKAQYASGAISLQDHVWWQGQADWMPLGVSPLLAAISPTIPETSTVPSANATGQETSNLAIWALVCGCLSLFLSLLASIPAIILGHMGLNQIKRNPGMQGRGMALAGLILGYVFTLILPIISIIAISILIALGNQVKSTFKTIQAQENSPQSTNSADQSATTSGPITNAPPQTTPAPASTNSPDQSTNSAPASTNSPDSSTNAAPSTNAPDATTNAAPMTQ